MLDELAKQAGAALERHAARIRELLLDGRLEKPVAVDLLQTAGPAVALVGEFAQAGLAQIQQQQAQLAELQAALDAALRVRDEATFAGQN
jgi:hypothetical protein